MYSFLCNPCLIKQFTNVAKYNAVKYVEVAS